MPDVLERRILGAFRMVSAVTANAIDADLALDAGALDVMRNRSGIYVVRDAPGMHELTLHSDLQGVTIPPQQQFELTVRDKQRVYLPRRFKLNLPRKIAPVSDQDSVMNAVAVPLYPTAAASTSLSWALLRVSVIKAAAPTPLGLPWSLVEVKQKSDGSLLKTGMTDARGEALVAVVGLPARAANGSGGALLTSDVEVDVVAFFDPDNLGKPNDYVPDPDELLAKQGSMKSNSQSLKIASGRTNNITIEIAV
jgi:hypothetical protein